MQVLRGYFGLAAILIFPATYFMSFAALYEFSNTSPVSTHLTGLF